MTLPPLGMEEGVFFPPISLECFVVLVPPPLFRGTALRSGSYFRGMKGLRAYFCPISPLQSLPIHNSDLILFLFSLRTSVVGVQPDNPLSLFIPLSGKDASLGVFFLRVRAS